MPGSMRIAVALLPALGVVLVGAGRVTVDSLFGGDGGAGGGDGGGGGG